MQCTRIATLGIIFALTAYVSATAAQGAGSAAPSATEQIWHDSNCSVQIALALFLTGVLSCNVMISSSIRFQNVSLRLLLSLRGLLRPPA